VIVTRVQLDSIFLRRLVPLAMLSALYVMVQVTLSVQDVFCLINWRVIPVRSFALMASIT
jgi:hypothetical protein